MPINYDEAPINKMRRKDREKDEEWIIEFLDKAAFAAIATLHGDQPFINTNSFVYDEDKHAIYFHTSKEGRLRYNVEKNFKVCLSCAEVGRFLPADVAMEFSVEYASVVVFGTVSIIEDEEDAIYALQKLNDKYFTHLKVGVDYKEITPKEVKKTTAFKLDISSWSGKKKIEADNFPGAFYFGENKT